jgi:type I restriction-modification system DNA methylase subunit
MTTIAQLTTVFKNILNILRDNESLTGEKALRNMTLLLALKMIEPRIEKEIMIDNYYFRNIEQYDLNKFLGDTIEEKQKEKSDFIAKMKRLTRLSNFVELQMVDYSKNILNLWTFVLSQHHILNKVFDNNKFDIKGSFTFFHVIKQLNSIDLNECDLDVLGAAYEEVIQDIFIGKVLGQFFTPLAVKKIMIDLIKPVVSEDGKIESCCDPTMGTGGFLISYVKEIIRQSKEKGIELDWGDITKNVYGKEIEIDTYKLAMSNMLIATGHMFNALEKGDSIRVPILKQYDCVLANPPFGIKGLKYTEFYYEKKHEYIPIKTDNAVSLFLQAIIFMLKVGGRCAIVLPDGQDLFSKTNKALVAVREYLMKSCDLQEIVYLPANTFIYTSIKTCVFYFVKKREMKDTMELKIKSMNKHPFSEISRNYNFVKEHATSVVKFYEMVSDFKEKKLLVEVPIDTLSKNAYSLNYMEYVKLNDTEQEYGSNIEVKTLGEVCNIRIGGTPRRNIKEYYEDGTNKWISVSELNGTYVYDTKEKITDLGVKKSNVKLFQVGTILFSFKLSIGKTAIVGSPMYSNEAIAGINSKNQDYVLDKYVFYFLKTTNFQSMAVGLLGKGSLNKETLLNIKIPIPSLEQQKEIVEYFDFVYEVQIKSSEKKIEGLKELSAFSIKNSQKVFCSTEVKTLGEICEMKNGKNISKDTLVHGDFPVVGGGKTPLGYHNEYNVNENTILISKDGAYAGYISRYDKKVFVSNHGIYVMNIKEDIVDKNYLYYYLKFFLQEKIYTLQTGSAQPGVNKKNILELTIKLPTLEKQKKIAQYCEFNNNMIQQLEKEISNNKELVREYLDEILKSTDSTTEDMDKNQQVEEEPVEPVESVEQAEEETQEPQEESDAKRHKYE